MKHFVQVLGPAPANCDMEKTYQLEFGGKTYSNVRVVVLEDLQPDHPRFTKTVVKRLTSARLAAVREMTLNTLESHYRETPTPVYAALTRALEAVLAAEVEVLRWKV